MSKDVTIKIKIDDGGSFKTVAVDADSLKDALSGVADKSKHLGSSGVLSSLKKYAGSFLSVTAAVTTAVAAIKNGVTNIANFERANSTLASVLGITNEQTRELAQAARDLGRTSEFSASEVTELQIALARLGFTQSQILAMQEPVLKFASAVGTDLASASDFAGSALRAFGLQASDTTALLDIMAASTSKSALDFGKLQTSISIVAPIAKAFGLTVSQTASFLGVLANNGFDASSAATALRNILLNLADSNGKLATGIGHSAKSFDEIISSFKELTSRGIDVNEVLQMTDKRAAAAAQTLITSADAVSGLNKELSSCNGTLNQMYDTMTDNVIGATNNLKSAWENLTLAFEESKGPLKDVLQYLADTLNYTAALVGGRGKEYLFDLDVDATIKQNEERGLGTYEDYLLGIKIAQNDLKRLQEQEKEWAKTSRGLFNPFTTRVKEAQRGVDILIAAKDKLYSDLEFVGPVLPTIVPTSPAGGGGGGGDSEAGKLAKDIQKYHEAVERAVAVNHAFGSSTSEVDARLAAMKSGLTALIGKYGAESDAVKGLISEYTKLNVSRVGLKDKLPELAPITTVAKGLSGVTLERPAQEVKKFITEAEKIEGAQTAISALGSTFGSLGDIVGEAAGAWLDWVGNLLSAISQAIPAIMSLVQAKKAEATANLEAAGAGAASSVASIPYVGPIMAVAAVASVIAAMANIPKFAGGGVVYGPTLGLFGEYANASSNPEVVSPVDTLTGIVADAVGAGGGRVEFVIKGRDLYGTLEKYGNYLKRG